MSADGIPGRTRISHVSKAEQAEQAVKLLKEDRTVHSPRGRSAQAGRTAAVPERLGRGFIIFK